MSWAVEEWKDGLPGKALQRIQEMEVQLDKLKKERSQKQFQLESLEAALQKQKQKVDSERNEISAMKRENQSLLESCDSLEKARQKAVHDLGIKEQQVNYLEGQLNACKKTIERLEQELKKYKNDLDRSQPAGNSSVASSDNPSFSTPQKGFATPAPVQAYKHHDYKDNRLEDLQEKYSQEVQERKKLENELKILQIKLLNQSSVSVSHKDIAARQQAGSSIFPWQQQEQSHSRHIQDAMETPLKRRGASLWELHDQTPTKPSPRRSCAVAMQSPSGSSQHIDQLKTQNQEFRSRVSELERNFANQEKQIKSQTSKLQEMQATLSQVRKDLTERDRDLAKKSHELTQATDKHQQLQSKCSSVEQKLKQVTEEMNCQRHNAESCKRALEQKLKDLERESQKELSQLQNTHQALERQMNQTQTKLTQEIQQSKKDYNVVQSDMEKLNLQKKQLEKEVEEHKQKLLRSEQSLQACQSKEQDMFKKFEELQREKNYLSVQQDQSSKRVGQLEDEKKNLDQTQKRSQGLLDDLRAKSESQADEVKRLQSKVEQQTRDLENMKRILSEAETTNSKSQSDLLKQRQEFEQVANKVIVLTKECEELKSCLVSAKNENAEVKQAHEALLQWKTEKETLVNDTEAVQNELKEKLSSSEISVNMLNETNAELKRQLTSAEEKHSGLSAQIDTLKGDLLNKCTELEEREHQYQKLQSNLSEVELKHSKDLDNVRLQVVQLEDQVKDIQMRLQREVARAEQAERRLLEEQQVNGDLLSSKDQLLELGQAEINQLRDSLSVATTQQEEQEVRLAEEKASLLKHCEERVLSKEAEIEELKLSLQEAQQDLLLTQNRISSMDQLMKVQEQLGEDWQKKIETLTEGVEQHKKALKEKSDEYEQIKQELNDLKCHSEEMKKCHKETADHIVSLEEQKVALENSIQELKQEKEIFNKATAEKINGLHEEISLLEGKVSEGKNAADRLSGLEDELQGVTLAYSEVKCNLEALERNHSSVTEIKSNLENTLVEKNLLITTLELSIKDLTEKVKTQSENHASEIEHFLTEKRRLQDQVEEVKKNLVATKTELRSRREEIKTMKATISAASSGLQERDSVIATLNEKLKKAEAEQGKSAELLKEKVEAMNKIKVQLEMLQMDLEDNETVMTSIDNQTEELKGTIESLEAQLANSNSNMSEMEARLEGTKLQVSELETQLEEIQAQNSSLEAQYVTAREELMDRSCEITRLEEEASQRKELEEAVAGLQTALDLMKVEHDILDTKFKQTIDQRDLLVTEKNNLQNDLILMEFENKELKNSINCLTEENSRQLQDREEQLRQLEVTITELSSEKNSLEAEFQNAIEKVLNEMSKVKEQNEELTLNKDQLCAQLTHLQKNFEEQLEERSGEKTQLEEAVCDLQKELDQTREENIKLQTDVKEMTERIDLLTQENQQLQNKVEQLGHIEAEVNEVISEIELHKEDPHLDIRSLEQSPASGQPAVETLQEELDKSSRQNEDLKEKENVLKVEQEVHQKLAGLQIELADFKKKYNLLQEQVKQQHDLILQLSEPQSSGSLPKACSRTEEMPLCGQHMEEAMGDGADVPKLNISDKMDVIPQECMQTGRDSERVTEEQCPKDDDVSPKVTMELHLLHEDMKSTEMPNDNLNGEDDKLQTLHCEIDLLNADLELRKEMSAEMGTYVQNMEQKMADMERKAHEAVNKLNVVSKENRGFVNQIGKLTEDNESLTLQLQTAKCQLADVMEMFEGLEMAKGGWDEKFLQQESELKRVRSEKANLEQHILGMEVELETLQEEGTKLRQEIDAQRRACSGMESSVERLVTETTQLRSELVSCSEERDDLSRSLSQRKEQVLGLEKSNSDTRELLSILEDDIRTRKREYDVLQSSMEKINVEREQLLEQVKTLEQTLYKQSGEKEDLIDQLEKIHEDHTSDINNSESLASKIQSLEAEVTRLTHSLESSLLEKGEIASRLNTTQDEVQQMRTGIEKLQVRIEADERKKKKMGELLKAAQRKADALQDRIDGLEREKDDIEQSLEEAVVQAESVKAELEEEQLKVEEEKRELSEKLKELSTELDHLKLEKESMELELSMKKEEIEALKAAKEELERVQMDRQQEVQQLEKAMEEATEKQTKEMRDVQTQLEDLHKKMLSLEQERTELEAERNQMQSVLVECKNEKEHLSCSLNESQIENQRLQTEEERLNSEKQSLNCRIGVLEKEMEELKATIAVVEKERVDLEVIRNQEEGQRKTLEKSISALAADKEQIEEQNRQVQEEKEQLESALVLVTQERDELKSTVTKFEKQENTEVQSKFDLMEKDKSYLEHSLSLLQQDNTKLHLEKEGLGAELKQCQSMNSLLKEEKDELNITMRSLEEEKKRVEECKEKLESEKELLQTAASSMEKELETSKLSISELNNQVLELTSRAERLSKDKDSALSKINLLMKTCKQLEEEKQVILKNEERENVSDEVRELKMEAEESEKLVQSLKASLQLKTSEAQQCNETLDGVKKELDLTKKELDTTKQELEETKIELNQLNIVVEEKSQEADESMDKYCTLMIQVHKLEEANDVLTTRLEQITNKQTHNADGVRRSSRKSASKLHSTENSENIPSSPLRSPPGRGKRGHCDVTNKDTAQEALHNLTKKLRATAVTTPKPKAQQDDEEFRPEGLPELVQRGFADIPLGEASPFIVRRTTVRRCSPRLSKQSSTSPDKVLEPLHLQSPSADVTSNRKRRSQSAKEQTSTENTQAQGENCHVQ
ncbi:unnamed protein product [Knipowitschia caucasica]